MSLEPWQWALGATAALMVGISKTGIPGIGILVVPLLAAVFGGRLSAGVMLPMLIMGDVFAVAWYRRHARWDKLVGLLPWVVFGMALGTAALKITGDAKGSKDLTDIVIGAMVLSMLALHLLRNRLGEQFAPTSPAGVASTGAGAGFATTVSNAAGPIMQMYLAAHRMPKEQFMGTIAWYFFIINVSKFPIYVVLSAMIPARPLVTASSLAFNAAVFPVIVVGVFIGRWLLPRIPQKMFDVVVIVLAAAGAVRLILS